MHCSNGNIIIHKPDWETGKTDIGRKSNFQQPCILRLVFGKLHSSVSKEIHIFIRENVASDMKYSAEIGKILPHMDDKNIKTLGFPNEEILRNLVQTSWIR